MIVLGFIALVKDGHGREKTDVVATSGAVLSLSVNEIGLAGTRALPSLRRRLGPATTGRCSCRWPWSSAVMLKLKGNWMMVGKLGSPTGIGLPRITVTPGGVLMNVRVAVGDRSRIDGLVEGDRDAPGVTVTTEPLAGLVEATRSTSTALMALMALIMPKPPSGPTRRLRGAVHRRSAAEAIRPARICAGVVAGHLLLHEGGHGRGVGGGGRRAEEAGQVSVGVKSRGSWGSRAGPGTADCCGVDDVAGGEERRVAAVGRGDGRVQTVTGVGIREPYGVEDDERTVRWS